MNGVEEWLLCPIVAAQRPAPACAMTRSRLLGALVNEICAALGLRAQTRATAALHLESRCPSRHRRREGGRVGAPSASSSAMPLPAASCVDSSMMYSRQRTDIGCATMPPSASSPTGSVMQRRPVSPRSHSFDVDPLIDRCGGHRQHATHEAWRPCTPTSSNACDRERKPRAPDENLHQCYSMAAGMGATHTALSCVGDRVLSARGLTIGQAASHDHVVRRLRV